MQKRAFLLFSHFLFLSGRALLSRPFEVVASSCAISVLKWAKVNMGAAIRETAHPHPPPFNGKCDCVGAGLGSEAAPKFRGSELPWQVPTYASHRRRACLLIALPLEAACIVMSGAPESEPAAPGLSIDCASARRPHVYSGLVPQSRSRRRRACLLIALPLGGRMLSQVWCPRVGAGGAGIVYCLRCR